MPTLLFPCAGHSKRYPGMRPKWMLTSPVGALSIEKAFGSIANDGCRRVIAIKSTHNEQFRASEILRETFGDSLEILVLKEDTAGPAATVAEMIKKADIHGPIVVKDADSFFDPLEVPDRNFVGCADLRNTPELSSVGGKSFLRINDQGLVFDIVEKDVISNYICSGVYGFASAETFLLAFDKNTEAYGGEVFVSHIIKSLLLDGQPFEPIQTSNLIDVGTKSDWYAYVAKQSTYVVDIDGVIAKNQSRHWSPRWGDQPEFLQKNVEALKALAGDGAQLIFMTARPEDYRAVTEKLLADAGLSYHVLIMGCHHGRRYLINDYATSNPYPSAVAINIPRNSDVLDDMIED